MNPLIFLLGASGALWWASRGRSPTAFLSFASEDANMRDLFVGQKEHPQTTWDFRDRSLHEPFERAWKTQTKEIISDCDVLIALIGKHTHQADGAIWEIKTAIRLGIPVFSVHLHKKRHLRGRVPDCLKGYPVVEWNHEAIAEQLDRILEESDDLLLEL